MIASVEGVVASVASDSLVLEAGGIGYRIFAAPAVLAAAESGKRLKLHTHHVVREDAQALYGFRTVDELGFFGLLLTVTGVGPKVALAIVGSRPVADLQLAILADDQAALTAISGVGKRLAGRIVLELKEGRRSRHVRRRRRGTCRRWSSDGERGRRGPPGARVHPGRGSRGSAGRRRGGRARGDAGGPGQGIAAGHLHGDHVGGAGALRDG
jgi:Holliday junction DNA helicase RuvA subunit